MKKMNQSLRLTKKVSIREEFPILSRKVNGVPLIYLDNAATTQKPESVLQSLDHFYRSQNANVHRGIHRLAEEATLAYENAHEKVAQFIGAKSMKEIVFTRGTTDSFNMLARMLEPLLKKGDEIVVSQIEHHSNLVPWQQLALRTQAKLKFIPLDKKSCNLDLSDLKKIITPQTKIVSVTLVSNVLGSVVPVQKLSRAVHQVGALIAVDAAQAMAHIPVDVNELECDFLCFSGHKMYGPTGIGVLYGKESLLQRLNPVSFGGEMVREVYFDKATWNSLPWKFEAGTPPIAEGIALGEAIDFLRGKGLSKIRAHEKSLILHAFSQLKKIKGIKIYGPSLPEEHVGVIAFNVKGIHAHDVASLLNEDGIAVRAGNHCAMPLMELLGVSASARASFGIYNTEKEVDALVESVKKAQKIFQNKNG